MNDKNGWIEQATADLIEVAGGFITDGIGEG